MITLLELNNKISDLQESVIENNKQIRKIIDSPTLNDADYLEKNKQIKALKKAVKNSRNAIVELCQVRLYIESGIQMEAIKEHKSILLVKISTITERAKQERIDKASKNPFEKQRATQFDTKYGSKKLKQQLAILNFILK